MREFFERVVQCLKFAETEANPLGCKMCRDLKCKDPQ